MNTIKLEVAVNRLKNFIVASEKLQAECQANGSMFQKGSASTLKSTIDHCRTIQEDLEEALAELKGPFMEEDIQFYEEGEMESA